ncbi:MAG: hypothetical protein DRI95_10590, partial [Bacteroidetes bacterium]
MIKHKFIKPNIPKLKIYSMRKKVFWNVQLFFRSFLIVSLISCSQQPKTDLTKAAVIPKPVSISANGGSFEINCQTGIFVNNEIAGMIKIGDFLSEILSSAIGVEIEVIGTDEVPDDGNIYMELSDDISELGEEGYKLTITDDLLT